MSCAHMYAAGKTAAPSRGAPFSQVGPLACRVGVRASRMLRSQVIDNDLNPKWDEDFKLLVHEPEHQVRIATLLRSHKPLEYTFSVAWEVRQWHAWLL